MQKIGPKGPKWGQEDFFLPIQTLPTFWAERILDLENFYFLDFFGSQISGLGVQGLVAHFRRPADWQLWQAALRSPPVWKSGE